jgi:hypothetical protein
MSNHELEHSMSYPEKGYPNSGESFSGYSPESGLVWRSSKRS